MRITKIEEQKRNKKKYNMYIDGEYHSSIDKEILDEMKFVEGMELNEDDFNQKLEIIQYKSALRSAFYILARSSKTENELKKKLKEKEYPEKAINQVLDYLRSIGYVNDNSYAESFIGIMKGTAGTSSRSLYYKLAGKGIDADVIQEKLEEADIDDYSSALKIAQKKLPGLKGDKREKTTKLIGYLYRKGFGMDVCRKIIEELDLEDN
jgi:regulatory protein